MDAVTLSIIVLVLLFLGAFLPRFSLALAVLPAVMLVSAYAGVDEEKLFGFFPSDFVILIVGITAFFAAAQQTGTTDWLLGRALGLIGERVFLIPLLLFAMGAMLTALGTLPAAVTAIMAPITLGLAAKRGLPPMLMCLVMLNGICAGLFSPIAVFGATTPRLMAKSGIDVPPGTAFALLAASVVAGLVISTTAMLVGRRSLALAAAAGRTADGGERVPGGAGSRPGPDAGPGAGPGPGPGSGPGSGSESGGGTATAVAAPGVSTIETAEVPGSARARWATVAALAVLVVGGVGFELNLGLLGITLAFVLQLLLGLEPAAVIRRLPWEIILMIAGLLTYVGLLEHLGTFDRISEALRFAGTPMLSLLAVCFVVGLTSFFASSIAVMATAVPLLAPLVDAGVNPIAGIVAVGLSAVLVDVNPLGITGGLLLGSAAPEHRARLFRNLMLYGLCSIVAAPLLAWAAVAWW